MSRREDLSELPVALSGSCVPPRLFPSVLIASDPLKVFLKDGSGGFLPVDGEDLPWSAAAPQLLSPPAHPALRPSRRPCPAPAPSAVPQCSGRTARRACVTALLCLRCAASVTSGLNLVFKRHLRQACSAGSASLLCFPLTLCNCSLVLAECREGRGLCSLKSKCCGSARDTCSINGTGQSHLFP